MNAVTQCVAAVSLMLCVSCVGNDGGPAAATGETPVRYVICSLGDKDCFVSARYRDFQSCESHKEIDAMLFDRRSTPGRIVCTKENDVLAVAYCTK